jgi:hypothetical protein
MPCGINSAPFLSERLTPVVWRNIINVIIKKLLWSLPHPLPQLNLWLTFWQAGIVPAPSAG